MTTHHGQIFFFLKKELSTENIKKVCLCLNRKTIGPVVIDTQFEDNRKFN